MIIPGLSEEKILEELVHDREIVAKEIKKKAKKIVARMLKEGRDGIDKDQDFNYEMFSGSLNNKWLCSMVVNMATKPYWYHEAVCKVESNIGSKDYYFVRGFSNNKPYFIKISSHTLKRFRERGVEERFNEKMPFPSENFMPFLIRKGETITWMKITDPKYLKLVVESEDENVLPILFYTLYGCYLGNKTEKGNYEFKTFLCNDKSLKKTGENDTKDLCHFAHVAFNPYFYNKKLVEHFKEEGYFDVVNFFDNTLMP